MGELTTVSTIENATQSILYDRTLKLDWIFPVLVNIILMVVHFWFLISLIHYGIKYKKCQNTRRKSDVLNTGLVYVSVIGCAVACIFRLIISLTVMNIGFSSIKSRICDQFGDAASASYGIVHLFVALFLWSRQRSFFVNKLLNFNYSRPIRYFSSYVIVFIFIFGLFATEYFCVNISSTSSRQGCIRSEFKASIHIFIIIAIAILFYNVSLLGLLSYALTRAKSFQKREIATSIRLQQWKFQNSNSLKKIQNPPKTISIVKARHQMQ